MTPQNKYIYGIIDESEPKIFKFQGVDNAPVYTITHDRISAVISNTHLQEIDPTRKNVQAHTMVQEELIDTYTLLPMSFGMVTTNPGKIRTLLAKNYQGLTQELSHFTGKVQVELKVFWDQEPMMKELQSRHHDFTRLKDRIKVASSPFEIQNLLVEVGKLIEGMAIEWKSKYADQIYAILRKLSCDTQLNNPTEIRNLLNASFLIERSEENTFKEEIHKLDLRFGGKVNFKYVGPLPPYNFINLQLETVE